MFKGWMGRILFVDLSSGELKEEVPDEQLYHDFLGGYGVGARILFSRQKAGCHPLGPDNTLGFVTGCLTGTPALLGSRYAVVAKSALTGSWGDANSGGDFGPYLKFSGYDAIFFTGISERPVHLFIQDGKPELRDASHLWGKDASQTEDMLKAELGKDVRVACIGPAGESMSLISCIINNKGRAAARSGLGAVMGSKKLKAVAVKGTMHVPLACEGKVKQLRRRYLPKLRANKLANMLRIFGTPSFNAGNAHNGECPVKNWEGVGIKDFPNADAISGDSVLRLQQRKYACWQCPIGCGGYMKAGTDYKYAAGTHKPEYETAAGFGIMCLNDNLESIVMANDICNRYGLDTMSTGATIAFAIECFENGLITKDETEGIELKWGNHRAIVAMTVKLARREGFGAILADGVKVAAERIGKGADKYAIHIGGQEVPFHDPKNSPGFGTSYKIDATPARHTQSGANSGKGEEQKARNTFCQVFQAAGVCQWVAFILGPPPLSEFMAAVTGYPYDVDSLLVAGERISNIRHAFNLREGLNPLKRQVPGRVLGSPPLQEEPLAGKTVDLDTRLTDYLKAMDWDPVSGKPSKRKLQQLGLEDVSATLWPVREKKLGNQKLGLFVRR